MATLTVISRKPLSFVLFSMAVLGAFSGLIIGISLDKAAFGLISGVALVVGLSLIAIALLDNEKIARWGLLAFWLGVGFFFFGPAAIV